jgi:uncharacterized protein YoaH (UPF0181 family)
MNTIIGYTHNNLQIKTLQHKTQKAANRIKTVLSKIKSSKETVELVSRKRMLPAEVNN